MANILAKDKNTVKQKMQLYFRAWLGIPNTLTLDRPKPLFRTMSYFIIKRKLFQQKKRCNHCTFKNSNVSNNLVILLEGNLQIFFYSPRFSHLCLPKTTPSAHLNHYWLALVGNLDLRAFPPPHPIDPAKLKKHHSE